MPAPSRTSHDAIVRAGAALLEEVGLPGLTMLAVAERVGVRAPSLYKHVGGRDDLVARIADATVRDLGAVLEQATAGRPADQALHHAAWALRSFAHERPAAFRLVFQPGAEATRADAEVSAAAVAPLLRTARDLVGEGDALAAARTVTAWASGFLSMELADAFRMGGDVDEAFAFGVETLVSALRLRGDAAVGRSPAVGAGG